MSQPKRDTHARRLVACEAVLDLIDTMPSAPADIALLDHFSEVKGLFNRIIKQDQWDWFTVARQLGYPSNSLALAIVNQIDAARLSLRERNEPSLHAALFVLRRLPTRLCLSVFLGLMAIKDEIGAGWVYVLSTRETRDLLKVGMTTRTVEERADEINRATGVAIPYGVRRCWRVVDPMAAERSVHARLLPYRLRQDREFFRVDFRIASRLIQEVITENDLEIRTLKSLAALDAPVQQSLFSLQRNRRS